MVGMGTSHFGNLNIDIYSDIHSSKKKKEQERSIIN